MLAVLDNEREGKLEFLFYDSAAAHQNALTQLSKKYSKHFILVDVLPHKSFEELWKTAASSSDPEGIICLNFAPSGWEECEEEEFAETIAMVNEHLGDGGEPANAVLVFLPYQFIMGLADDRLAVWKNRSGVYLVRHFKEERDHTDAIWIDPFYGPYSYENFRGKRQRLELYRNLARDYRRLKDGPGADLLMECLANKARLLYQFGDYNGALRHLQLQLKLAKIEDQKKTFPEIYNNLGMVYETLSRFAEAMDYYLLARETAETTFRGSNHPAKALITANIAHIYNLLGNYQEAFLECRKALRMCESKLGMRHPLLVPVLLKYARISASRELYEDALDQYRRALQVVERKMELDHPLVAALMHGIGQTYVLQGKYELALRYLYRTVENIERTVGPKHPFLAEIFVSIGQAHFHNAEEELARQYFRWAIDIREKYIGPADIWVAHCKGYLGKIAHHEAKFPEAQALFTEALDIFRAKLPSGHPWILNLQNSLYQMDGGNPPE